MESKFHLASPTIVTSECDPDGNPRSHHATSVGTGTKIENFQRPPCFMHIAYAVVTHCHPTASQAHELTCAWLCEITVRHCQVYGGMV